MITLLGKYHAYAPPFKYVSPVNPEITYIGGVEGRVQWSAELETTLRAEWERAHAALVEAEYKIPSQSRAGVVYTVRRILGEFTCSCPARSECWHIKTVKRLELDRAPLEFDQRSNDYRDA